ncbi:protein translocase subunit SecF [Desulfovermiculus halophilus]|uniref:protein translocase subunit SecF n=1 Tax=Desulfovermiculus halophilus TaxID=339722 RepID=UPI0004869FB4|nr:protein translocase subunit SecF [Desulfovermiculus halophilus]
MGLRIIKPDTNIDFMGKRVVAMIASILVLALGLGAVIYNGGLNYGIDFAGGINIQVKFARDVEVREISQALRGQGLPEIRVQELGLDRANEYLLRISALDVNAEEMRDRIGTVLSENMTVDSTIQRLEMVGPKVGADLKNKALQALFYAVLFISIYISGRFEQRWMTAGIMAAGLLTGLYVLGLLALPLAYLVLSALLITLGLCWYLRLNYALGAVVALIHDVLITVGIFALLGKEFDLTTVAALLTIIGYSLNDTIIIYDRIRENLRSKNAPPLFQTINRSVNQTLSRTLLTSGTTLMVVLCLIILGGGVIHDFALALLIGILVGTYSSIFVAGSLLLGIGPTPENEPEEEAVQAA